MDVSGVNTDKFDDAYFSKPAEKKAKKTEKEFFSADADKKSAGVSDARKADQKAVDASIVKAAGATMTSYLKSTFTLSKNQFPHEMVF